MSIKQRTRGLARRYWIITVAALPLGAGGCLDLLGYEEEVTQRAANETMARIADDKIEDKHPISEPGRTVTESFGNWSPCPVTMNKSAAVTKLDLVPFEGDETALTGKLFRGRKEALAAVAAVPGTDPIPSMEVVNGHLKPFNDGLYAAIELEVEAEKHQLLTELGARIAGLLATADANARPALQDAAVLVGAALWLGHGEMPALEASLQGRARARAEAFAAELKYSRPIGFYTWTTELARIFARDRFLQNGDKNESFAAFQALALVLGQDPALLAAYQRVVGLYAGLTNPFVSYPIDSLVPYVSGLAALGDAKTAETYWGAHPPLPGCWEPSVAFLPASRSKDADYFNCNSVPEGTPLLDALIQAVQAGAVDLALGKDAGFYDYQLYALETLLLPERGPESQHLLLTVGYKKKLLETFKSILIQSRETHVKQLAVATASSANIEPVDIYPLLPAEPFPSFYLRSARGYRFLRTFLQAARGTDFLNRSQRVIETGARGTETLSVELDRRIAILYGLSFLSADAVGMARAEGLLSEELAELDVPAAVAAARTWLDGWQADPDVARDPRVIVPIFYEQDGSTRYAAVIGVKAMKARAAFVPGHEPVVTPTACWSGEMVPHDYVFLVEETAEVLLPPKRPPPTRDELRALCDAHSNKADIVRALGSR